VLNIRPGNLKPLISICIPTFNRCNKVYKLVNDILKYQGEEIEVLVLDNYSTDETKNLLTKITDSRLSFIQSEVNTGGILNPIKSLTLASGKFAFLCLDKDYLDYLGIKKLIKHISADENIVFGYCALNIQKESPDIIYEKGYQSVINMAYLSRHPTGIFYKTDEYINLPIVKSIFVEKKPFSFYPDLINAEMAMIGKSQLINVPAFYTESTDEARNSPSFTYDVNNLYFSPAKRLNEFNTYLDSAQKLGLVNDELIKLIWKLYRRGLLVSTFGYKKMMSDDDVCAHHKISARKVSILEIWKLNFSFASYFLKRQIKINMFKKILIVLYGHTIVLAKSVLSK
jgi:glycosyltransferase involved in cell wall biosynthesis